MTRFAPLACLCAVLACRRDVQVLDQGETTGAPASETAHVPGSSTGDPPTPADTTTDGESDGPKFDVMPLDDVDPHALPSCERLAELGPSSLGCEFWAADLLAEYPDRGLGIGVGNPGDVTVHVVIEDLRGPGGTLREIGAVELAPTESTVISINGIGGLIPGEDVPVEEGFLARSAFRIRADAPITAMQINPVGASISWIPEASLLLPTPSLGTSHYAFGFGGMMNGDFVMVVATEDGTIVSTTEGDAQLDAFDTFLYQMWTPDTATGFFVGANRPVAVFSGNHCTFVGGVTACDHLEEQLMPLAAWGTHYVGAMHPQRKVSNPEHEPIVWRVIAGVDDTTVTLDPPLTGGPIELANAGDELEFTANEHFLATSDPAHPFMLVQYMTGAEPLFPACGSGKPAGDPWMLQMIPTDQWLPSVPFVTDVSYVRDFVFVAREAGTNVTVECFGSIPDDRFEQVGSSEFEVGWVDLDDEDGGEGECADGQQFLYAEQPVGVYVGGVDCWSSYGYPGGMSIDALWDPPSMPPG
jgi:hypothetical protein